MSHRHFQVLIFTGALLGLMAGAWANGVAPEPAPAAAQQSAPQQTPGAAAKTIFNFGERDAACLRWTDGCRTCTREDCSNIGIACQPVAPTCSEKAPAKSQP